MKIPGGIRNNGYPLSVDRDGDHAGALNARFANHLLTPPRSLFGHRFAQPDHRRLKIVLLRASSAGFGEAAPPDIFDGLIRELTARGHDVVSLERRAGADSGKSASGAAGHAERYSDFKELKDRFASVIRDAELVIVSSHLSEGIEIGEWVTSAAQGGTAFYDLNPPSTISGLIKGRADYISSALIPRFSLYLSVVGGPVLAYLEKHYGLPMARPLYCSVDAKEFFPEPRETKWDLGYLGEYDKDRQPALEELLIEPARRWKGGRFLVAGSQYPRSAHWPRNVERARMVAPRKRREFYNSQRFTLNITPPNATATGFSPNVRLFQAAACGTPVITEFWPGLETFFKPDQEILIAHSPDEALIYLEEISELERRRIGYRAREHVLAKHTTRHRAFELENYALQVLKLSVA